MSRMQRALGALALAAACGAGWACGGSGKGASAAEEAGASGSGEMGEDRPTECCCQRYDDDGSPTGATISDTTACKSTGGICTNDESQCAEE